MAKRGRTSKYSEELAAEVCMRLSAGETLRGICKDEHIPAAPTIIGWCDEFPSFAERYARARRDGHDAIAEDTMRIADDQSLDPNSRRIMVDARKWLLSKLAPKKYGERLELAGDATAPVVHRVVFVAPKKLEDGK